MQGTECNALNISMIEKTPTPHDQTNAALPEAISGLLPLWHPPLIFWGGACGYFRLPGTRLGQNLQAPLSLSSV